MEEFKRLTRSELDKIEHRQILRERKLLDTLHQKDKRKQQSRAEEIDKRSAQLKARENNPFYAEYLLSKKPKIDPTIISMLKRHYWTFDRWLSNTTTKQCVCLVELEMIRQELEAVLRQCGE